MPDRPLDPLLLAAYDAQAALVALPDRQAVAVAGRGKPQSASQALAHEPPFALATALGVRGMDPTTPATKQIASARGPVRAEDAVRLGVLELVLAGLDLGVTPDRQALRVSARLLAQVLGERHGGKAIEVRVPPYAAVQIGEGVTHTRGTPPNVVECAPDVFVALASGRRSWTDAVAAGEVRASGSRADLRPYLPLL